VSSFAHRNQLDFLAFIKIEIEIAELDSFFAAAGTAGMEPDPVQHDEIGCNACARGRR
jgi:hypothetical protein